MIAVGVARPIAHGQAMTTTVMKAASARVTLRLRAQQEPQSANVRAADGQDDRDEDPADPVGQPLDRGLAALGAADHLDDLGEGGLAPDPGRPEDEAAGRVQRRPDDLVARAPS